MEIELQGLQSLIALIHHVPEACDQTAMAEMTRTANVVFNESQKQVPVRWGILKASGIVDVDEGRKEVSIAYGGPAADYALYVHENLSAAHVSPTKAKYLEDPMNAHMRDLPEGLKANLEVAILGQAGHRMLPNAVTKAFPHAAQRKRVAIMARSRPMTTEEVNRALAGVKGRMHRSKRK